MQTLLPDLAVILHPGLHATGYFETWRPTLELLKKENVPVVMTTYNHPEYLQTIQVSAFSEYALRVIESSPYVSLKGGRVSNEPENKISCSLSPLP